MSGAPSKGTGRLDLADVDPSAGLADLKRLAGLIERYAPNEGRFDLSLGGLYVVKATKTTGEGSRSMAQPGMCIVAQGAKSVTLAERVYAYDESRLVVYAAEVPVNARIIKASKEEPYLCLVVPIDPHKLADLILKVFPNGVPRTADTRPIYVGQSNPKIVKSATRLMEILLEQEDADLLAPLLIDEVLIRLLRSPEGPSIAQIGIVDSNSQKVSRVITWLKQNYAEPIKVEKLAEIAGMSASSFHSHFKSVTSLSPLQFQKNLRLQEARNLMISRMMDVSNASFHVGYSSVSQFSREYSRFFGHSPGKDISRLRAQPASK